MSERKIEDIDTKLLSVGDRKLNRLNDTACESPTRCVEDFETDNARARCYTPIQWFQHPLDLAVTVRHFNLDLRRHAGAGSQSRDMGPVTIVIVRFDLAAIRCEIVAVAVGLIEVRIVLQSGIDHGDSDVFPGERHVLEPQRFNQCAVGRGRVCRTRWRHHGIERETVHVGVVRKPGEISGVHGWPQTLQWRDDRSTRYFHASGGSPQAAGGPAA